MQFCWCRRDAEFTDWLKFGRQRSHFPPICRPTGLQRLLFLVWDHSHNRTLWTLHSRYFVLIWLVNPKDLRSACPACVAARTGVYRAICSVAKHRPNGVHTGNRMPSAPRLSPCHRQRAWLIRAVKQPVTVALLRRGWRPASTRFRTRRVWKLNSIHTEKRWVQSWYAVLSLRRGRGFKCMSPLVCQFIFRCTT